MKRLQKMIALILCVMMTIPTQTISTLAESKEHINKILPLESLEEELAIYWDPEGEWTMASPSDADNQLGTPSNAKKGKDYADGLSESSPVKTLAAALKRAEEMRDNLGVDIEDITIYAMSPMEIADGQLYFFNGKGIRIASWSERDQESDVIFYVNGGQLTLKNVTLISARLEGAPEDTELVLIDGGTLQLGEKAEVNGQIVMDYCLDRKEEIATNSDASTWRKPVIELIEGFAGSETGYHLRLCSDSTTKSVNLVESLYADELSTTEFQEFFSLSQQNEDEWKLSAYSHKKASIYDTGTLELARFSGQNNAESLITDALTVKILRANKIMENNVIYWNPGGSLVVGDKTYLGGVDVVHDGTTPEASVKTLGYALSIANGGTIVCMQGLTLGDDIDQYLDYTDYTVKQPNGSYFIRSLDELIVNLKVWDVVPQPVFKVPEGTTLILEAINLGGIIKDGTEQTTQTILCEGGDIIIDRQVSAEYGYIQINAFAGLKDHPIIATSTDGGKVTLLFGGINDNLLYRYTDVVVPGGDLASEAVIDPVNVGLLLAEKYQLELSNRDDLNGGKSRFDWYLRPDAEDDDTISNPQNLELYADYYYDAIYLDGERGDDTNFGATCTYPVKTWTKAKQLWEQEIEKSITKRLEMSGLLSEEEINRRFPLPQKIYVCGTVTIDGSVSESEWTLTEKMDYDNTSIRTEIVSHNQGDLNEQGNYVHESPNILFLIKDGKSISLKDLYIRNITHEKNSITVRIEDGELMLDGTTVMTGESQQDEVTFGTHIYTQSKLSLLESWTGSIERRQHGITAKGISAEIQMMGGYIQENNSYDMAGLDNPDFIHDYGAGVILEDGASMKMSGGEITKNKVYQYGAGIYLDGVDTKLEITKGIISNNEMERFSYSSNDETSELMGYGIGIYAGAGTIVNLGSLGGSQEDVQIIGNKGYLVSGAGIYSEGDLNMNYATVSGNISQTYVVDTAVSYGIGINVTNGTLSMNHCLVSENETQMGINYENCMGAGIYIESSQEHTIRNSEISKNKVGYSYRKYSYNLYPDATDGGWGGGIAVTSGILNIEDSEIFQNKASQGGGISVKRVNDTTVNLKNTAIFENLAHNSLNTADDNSISNFEGYGGGICAYGNIDVKLLEGTIVENNKGRNGGGVYGSGSPRITLDGSGGEHVVIQGNLASAVGAGILAYNGTIYGTKTNIIKNITAGNGSGNGGGIYTASNTTLFLSDMKICENEAAYGGGMYISGSSYLSDMVVEDNIANASGGGLYIAGTNTNIYMSETLVGKFSINGNQANQGGGIYQAGSSVIMKLAGDFQNIALVQGSNLYVATTTSNRGITIINGIFKQPEIPIDGVYNLYVYSVGGGNVILDMEQVQVEKKMTGQPDAIYLHTSESYLTYLTMPSHNTLASFPIDVNTEVFKTGSVVIKPANKTSVSNRLMNVNDAGLPIGNYRTDTINYTRLTDATENLKYSSGGQLPRRSQLGGYRDAGNPSLINAIIVGEGIYLASEKIYNDVNIGGDDTNTGDSPQQAVATFEVAKRKLEERIREEYENPLDDDGYSPFIYICGKVLISEDEVWELDSTSDLFTTINEDYILTEEAIEGFAAPAQVRRFASFVTEPMIQVGTIVQPAGFQAGDIKINGMSEAVAASDQGAKSPILQIQEESVATLLGNAEIFNNRESGIDLYGMLVLNGKEEELNEQIKDHEKYGVFIKGTSAKLEMKGYSKILATDASGIKGSFRGINDTAGGTVWMKDHSQIYGNYNGSSSSLLYGIYSEKSNGFTIYMDDFASIKDISSVSVYFKDADSPALLMNMNAGTKEDSASIFSSDKKGITGISLSGSSNVKIQMGARARIDNFNQGINIAAKVNDLDIQMGDQANIKKCSSGIRIYGSTSEGEMNILMKDDSEISENNQGIILSNGVLENPMKIHLKDRASIKKNNNTAISCSTTQSVYWEKLNILMEGNARLSGNREYGIYLPNGYRNEEDVDDYLKIVMKDFSIIGGDSYYSSGESTSGNGRSGIYSGMPVDIYMSGNARISGNGGMSDYVNLLYTNAISLTRTSSAAFGTSNINLSGNASLNGNLGGVYVETSKEPNSPNRCEIILDGTKGGTPSIQGNTDGIYLGKDAGLHLAGKTLIGNTTYATPARSIVNYGHLELDGRSTVEGPIQLHNSQEPIVMTHQVDDPQRIYHLEIADSFMGKPVVRPDDPVNQSGGLTDVTDQLSFFVKDIGYGLAADKSLIAVTPNIVLTGENNVYLSGKGLDTNDGNSPTTPVRTFRRAKELLSGGGYYTSGANIIICGTVPIESSTDNYWSFGPDGNITNSISTQTWKPLVIRYKSFLGTLVEVASEAGTVTFEHITLDGGSESGIILNTTKDEIQLLKINNGGEAVLGRGAVLQNNENIYHAEGYLGMNLGVYVDGGTLEVDGGTIRGLKRTATYSIAYAMNSQYQKYAGLAISCTEQGRVIFKSGMITDNTWISTLETGNIGMIYLDTGSTMEMSGGSITGNSLQKRKSSTPYMGSMILSQDSQLSISGGIIRDNIGGYGSALGYLGDNDENNNCIISGGLIENHTVEFYQDSTIINPIKEYSPVFVGGSDFQLKGGGANIKDCLYLDSITHNIKVSGDIYQTGRLYGVYVNQGASESQYKKGSIVVQPDGMVVMDASRYLLYFEVRSSSYILDRGQTNRMRGDVRDNECLLLMQAVYLDSIAGDDQNDGMKPLNAIKTFEQAKILGERDMGAYGRNDDYYVIYLSGPAINNSAETWSLPETAYMCRYTGFTVYELNGFPSTDSKRKYSGSLLIPAYDLVLDGISVYGRRSIDPIDKNGDSMVHIQEGKTVSLIESEERKTILGRNYNIGTYLDYETGVSQNLTARGGAVRIDTQGKLDIQAGTILETDAAYGSAIYIGTDDVDETKNGFLWLSNKPVISGQVYLSGHGNTTAAYVEPDVSFAPVTALSVDVGNDYHGRAVVQYRDGTIPGLVERQRFSFSDSIQGLYSIINRENFENVLELEMRRTIYLDGQNGQDTEDGSTPERAFKTLRRVYEEIQNTQTQGTVVSVVDTIEIMNGDDITITNILIAETSTEDSYYKGSYDDGTNHYDIRGQVYFMRYAKPDGYDPANSIYDGFSKETLAESMFWITDGGALKLNGMYLDGHSQDVVSSELTMTSKGVLAKAPLITVEGTGVLGCELVSGNTVANGIDTSTLFMNNVNVNMKSKILGDMNGVAITEGSSAGVELLDGGTCYLVGTEFKNLELGEHVISGGTDVYSNGKLHYKMKTLFSGTVFLEGRGTYYDEDSKTTSRFITIDAYGTPMLNDFQLLMRDPYWGRTVVYYAPEGDEPPVAGNISMFRLEEIVKKHFYLNQRSGAPYILELQVPSAVYVDGINGIDDQGSVHAGSTPRNPVKTLEQAYSLLKTRSGNTIYVVGTVQINTGTLMYGNIYVGESQIVLGATDRIHIKRYVQPDFAYGNPDAPEVTGQYDVPDFTGTLIQVNNGANLTLGENVFIDGHSEEVDGQYPKELIVTLNGGRTDLDTKSPMILVEQRASLNLKNGAVLRDSNNTYTGDERDGLGLHGGVIRNSGTTIIESAVFEHVKAQKGSGVYQDGMFTIEADIEKLADHSFYLTTENTGTIESPIWGEDHVIRITQMIPDNLVFDVNMDNPVTGRDVVRFLNDSAFDPNADAEHEHFRLGDTVPLTYFLVQAEDDEMVLELQDWKILDVEVPSDIYLVVQRKGKYDSTTKLASVSEEAAGDAILTAPEYSITNNGIYDVKVSISEFKHKPVPLEATLGVITLNETTGNLTNKEDLYLAIKGLGPGEGGNNTGFTVSETSLKSYSDGTAASPIELGTLEAGNAGRFTFVGAAGDGFVDHYQDLAFPLTSREEAQKHMDGSNGTINARAQYELRYELELVPPRREHNP